MSDRPFKPLGRKAYGSIPHLPGSRLGPADHHCHVGQETICTSKVRDRHDRVIVTEKLDGACVSVARIGQDLIPLIRAGYPASSAHYEHLRRFDVWARDNAGRFDRLPDGYRLCGEWLALAHGTRYQLDGEPFIPFDLIAGDKREPHDAMVALCATAGLRHAHVISDGPPMAVEQALAMAGDFGGHGAIDPIEGAVWRVERRGVFDFIAKYVKPSKVDGAYLTDITGHPEVWHWHPSPYATEN